MVKSRDTIENHLFVYPSGKLIILHLLRCQGLAIVYYGFTLGRLGATAFSAFATMGLPVAGVLKIL
jgi:hypothetical protein